MGLNFSLKQRFLIAFRMLGAASVACFITTSIVYFILLFIHLDLLVDAHCDIKCSRVLVHSGVLALLPFVFLPTWALLTYITEIVILKKMKDAPSYACGVNSVLILVLGFAASFQVGIPAPSYVQIIRNWQQGATSKESMEYLEIRLSEFQKIRVPASFDTISEQ